MEKEYKMSWWSNTKFFLEFLMFGCAQVIMPIIGVGMILYFGSYIITLGINAASMAG